MKIVTRILLLFLIVTMSFSFNSCKKYEDGPGISFRTKVNRLAGTWEVKKIEDAFGQNLLNYQIASNDSQTITNVVEDRNLTFEFEKNNTYVLRIQSQKTTTVTAIGGVFISTLNENIIDLDEGYWEFSEDKESIELRPDDPYGSYLIEVVNFMNFTDNVGVKISRLTNKEFNFEDDYGNIWELESK